MKMKNQVSTNESKQPSPAHPHHRHRLPVEQCSLGRGRVPRVHHISPKTLLMCPCPRLSKVRRVPRVQRPLSLGRLTFRLPIRLILGIFRPTCNAHRLQTLIYSLPLIGMPLSTGLLAGQAVPHLFPRISTGSFTNRLGAGFTALLLNQSSKYSWTT